ncbi:ABC transporter ATP-binding protein [Paenibacillus tepidiphilus]|uniref:ABC transporter ATP-binding protein n=1 Tax=Paenibacillus tepidiphilus TaxID=2608683 RepID=UPI00193E7144|nr:ABC transporter ATP-binding protein [Paenibacillus tepidiphilus]
MLDIKSLTIASRNRQIVRGIDLSVRPGEWLALAGESGSGKSLTAAAIGGLLPGSLIAGGTLIWRGCEVSKLPPAKRRRLLGREIGYIFQNVQGAFTPFLKIGKQMDEVLYTHTELNRSERIAACLEALADLNLPAQKVYSGYPHQLSGGQLQRAAIAMALILKPGLLIADEPTTALDSLSAHKVLRYINAAQEKHGMSVLWITHDLRHVRKYADRVAIMHLGEIVEQGNAADVLTHPGHAYTRRLLAAVPALSPGAVERPGDNPPEAAAARMEVWK